MREKSFKVYIFRLLKAIHSNIHITKPSVEAIDSIIRVTADKIMDRALILTNGDNKKTISSTEIKTAAGMVLPDSLSKEFEQLATNALNKFWDSENERKKQPVEKAQTRESRCGLIFSVSAAEKYIRRFGQIGYNVAASAPIYLAAILEGLSRKLLDISGTITKDHKKITITIRHIFLALTSEKLLQFMDTLGIVFLGGGVEPQNIQNKQHKRIRRAKRETNANEPKPHRWRPGTKTVLQIRRLQKSGKLLMQHAPFNRLVREIAVKYVSDPNLSLRFTSDFFTALQSFTEDRLTQLMKQSNSVATHAGRETVYARDVKLVCDLFGFHLSDTLPSYQTNIPEAALRQMALRAGIKRFGECSCDSYRTYMIQILENQLCDIVACAVHHKIQTLNTKLLLEAMSMKKIFPTITPHKRKVGGRKGASRTNSKVVEPEIEPKKENEIEEPQLSDVEEEPIPKEQIV